MHRINIEFFFKANFQIVSLLKIAPYHMPKFGRYRILSYLCTSNRKKCLRCPEGGLLLRPTRVINDGRRRSSMKTSKTAGTGRSGELQNEGL